MGTSLITW